MAVSLSGSSIDPQERVLLGPDGNRDGTEKGQTLTHFPFHLPRSSERRSYVSEERGQESP